MGNEPNNTATEQEKLFTQEDVNRIVGERLARIKSDSGIAETYKQERDEALEKLRQYENNAFLKEKGVPADYMEFVSFKASQRVNDKTTFQDAVTQFLKENPRYAGPASGYRVVMSGSTARDNFSGKGSNVADDPEAIRKAMGLKG